MFDFYHNDGSCIIIMRDGRIPNTDAYFNYYFYGYIIIFEFYKWFQHEFEM